jgi:hypothetical protein
MSQMYVAVLNVAGNISLKGASFTRPPIIELCKKIAKKIGLTVYEEKCCEWHTLARDIASPDPSKILLWYELVDVVDTALDAMVSDG